MPQNKYNALIVASLAAWHRMDEIDGGLPDPRNRRLRAALLDLGIQVRGQGEDSSNQRHLKPVRKAALKAWLSGAERELSGEGVDTIGVYFDSFDTEAGYECKWQNNARDDRRDDDWHVSYFCSLGEWASNLTDLLLDDRYDNLVFTGDDPEPELLSRYYTRILLVVSEMLTDFQDILKKDSFKGKLKIKVDKAARKKLSEYILPSSSVGDVESLLRFINEACKHKSERLEIHHHNHHLPIWFADAGPNDDLPMPLSCTMRPESPESVLMPSLEDVIQAVVSSYKVLDKVFAANTEEFKDFCSQHGKQIFIP